MLLAAPENAKSKSGKNIMSCIFHHDLISCWKRKAGAGFIVATPGFIIMLYFSCWLPSATQSRFRVDPFCCHGVFPVHSFLSRSPLTSSMPLLQPFGYDEGVLPTPALMLITYMYQVWGKLLTTHVWYQTHYPPAALSHFLKSALGTPGWM